jgi:hypothetical protein
MRGFLLWAPDRAFGQRGLGHRAGQEVVAAANNLGEDRRGLGLSWIGSRGFIGASIKDLSSTYGVVAEADVFIQLEQTR